MKTQFKIIFLALLLPALAFAGPEKFKGKYTKEKTLKKEYTVNSNAALKIENSYGNIDIVTWNENRTSIVVTIKTNGDDEDEVQKKLDNISVDFSGNGSQVNAKTLFNESKSSWSLFGNKKNNVSMKIDYVVKIPVSNSVNISNNYGAISINKLQGKANISCDYGQLIIGELLAENNLLAFDYTDNSTISYIKSGKINADYSDFTIEKAENIGLSADYSNSEIREVKKLKYSCDYGKININMANEIVGNGRYLPTQIGTVSGSLNLNNTYGSIAVENMAGNNTNINADYTPIKLGFTSDYSFNFSANLTYASLNGKDLVTLATSPNNSGSNAKAYKGFHKKENSGNNLIIASNYGSVTFIKN